MSKKIFKVKDELFLNPVHPGKTLSTELNKRKISGTALALSLCVPANRINEIIRGKRNITPDTAIRLGKYFSNGARFWMNLQLQYDLANAQIKFGALINSEVIID